MKVIISKAEIERLFRDYCWVVINPNPDDLNFFRMGDEYMQFKFPNEISVEAEIVTAEGERTGG